MLYTGQPYRDESSSHHPAVLITAELKIKTVANLRFPPNFAQNKAAKNKL